MRAGKKKMKIKKNVNNVQKAKNQSNSILSYFKKLFIPSATRSGWSHGKTMTRERKLKDKTPIKLFVLFLPHGLNLPETHAEEGRLAQNIRVARIIWTINSLMGALALIFLCAHSLQKGVSPPCFSYIHEYITATITAITAFSFQIISKSCIMCWWWSSRNWKTSNCPRYSTLNYHGLDDWEPSSTSD